MHDDLDNGLLRAANIPGSLDVHSELGDHIPQGGQCGHHGELPGHQVDARAVRDSDSGVFVIGYTTIFDRSVIPDVLDELRQKFPDWQFVTRGKHSISLIRDIKIALAAGHPLARKRKLGFDDLRGERLFWFERRLNPGFHDHCQACFEQRNFKPEILPEPADHHILLGLIAEGRGLALIPSSSQKLKRQGVVFRPLKEDSDRLTAGIAVTYLAHNDSPVLRAFLEWVRARKAEQASR